MKVAQGMASVFVFSLTLLNLCDSSHGASVSFRKQSLQVVQTIVQQAGVKMAESAVQDNRTADCDAWDGTKVFGLDENHQCEWVQMSSGPKMCCRSYHDSVSTLSNGMGVGVTAQR